MTDGYVHNWNRQLQPQAKEIAKAVAPPAAMNETAQGKKSKKSWPEMETSPVYSKLFSVISPPPPLSLSVDGRRRLAERKSLRTKM